MYLPAQLPVLRISTFCAGISAVLVFSCIHRGTEVLELYKIKKIPEKWIHAPQFVPLAMLDGYRTQCVVACVGFCMFCVIHLFFDSFYDRGEDRSWIWPVLSWTLTAVTLTTELIFLVLLYYLTMSTFMVDLIYSNSSRIKTYLEPLIDLRYANKPRDDYEFTGNIYEGVKDYSRDAFGPETTTAITRPPNFDTHHTVDIRFAKEALRYAPMYFITAVVANVSVVIFLGNFMAACILSQFKQKTVPEEVVESES